MRKPRRYFDLNLILTLQRHKIAKVLKMIKTSLVLIFIFLSISAIGFVRKPLFLVRLCGL